MDPDGTFSPHPEGKHVTKCNEVMVGICHIILCVQMDTIITL